MGNSMTTILKRRRLQLTVLVVLFAAALTACGSRLDSPTIAIGEQSVGEITTQIAERLGDDYGELCAEYSASSIVGEAVDSGLTPDSPVPSVLELRAQNKGGTLGAYKQAQLGSERVVFAYWTDKAPSQLSERENIAMAIEYRLILGDGEGSPDWAEIELEVLYPC